MKNTVGTNSKRLMSHLLKVPNVREKLLKVEGD